MFIEAEKQPAALNLQEIANKIEYPRSLREEAFRQGAPIKGRVMFRVLVDEEGNYVKRIVTRSPDEAFTRAGETHLRELRFPPAIAADNGLSFGSTRPLTLR